MLKGCYFNLQTAENSWQSSNRSPNQPILGDHLNKARNIPGMKNNYFIYKFQKVGRGFGLYLSLSVRKLSDFVNSASNLLNTKTHMYLKIDELVKSRIHQVFGVSCLVFGMKYMILCRHVRTLNTIHQIQNTLVKKLLF